MRHHHGSAKIGVGLSAAADGRRAAAQAAVIEQTDLDRVVPVAAAHAGWVAIELRRHLGADRVPGFVSLDWMVLGPPPPFSSALAALQDPEQGEQVRAGLFSMWTTDVTARAVHDYVARMETYGFDNVVASRSRDRR